MAKARKSAKVLQSGGHTLSNRTLKADPKIVNMIPKESLNVITYNLAYSFDRKIKSTVNPLSSISEDRFQLSLKQPIFDAYEKELSLSNKIFF